MRQLKGKIEMEGREGKHPWRPYPPKRAASHPVALALERIAAALERIAAAEERGVKALEGDAKGASA